MMIWHNSQQSSAPALLLVAVIAVEQDDDEPCCHRGQNAYCAMNNMDSVQGKNEDSLQGYYSSPANDCWKKCKRKNETGEKSGSAESYGCSEFPDEVFGLAMRIEFFHAWKDCMI